MISAVSILAQTEPVNDSPDLFSYILQYGFPGVVIVSMLVGLIWAKPAVDRLIKDKEKAEAQRDDLLRVYEEKMLPALTDSITITRDLKPVIQDVTNVLSKVKDELGRGQR
jgi:hypothetical protein